MARCIIEEYAMMGFTAEMLMKMFKNPFYQALHRVYVARGEEYVRGLLDSVCQPSDGSDRSDGSDKSDKVPPPTGSRSTENAPRHTEDDARYTEDDARHTEDDARYTEDDARHTEDDARYTEDDARYTEDDARYTEDDSRYTGKGPSTFSGRPQCLR